MNRIRKRIKKRTRYERLIPECRRLWNRFDPIGVGGALMDDEYDRYVARTAKMLAEGADAVNVADYVRNVVRNTIGISDIPEDEILEYARQLTRLSA